MPLIKSKSPKAFEHNLKAELEAGKPKAQSLAIAYSTQRHARGKKMATGGEVMPSHEDHYASIADAILKKKHDAAMPQESGEVDLEENAMEHQPDDLEHQNLDADLKEDYAEDEMLSAVDPIDSNEPGDDVDSDDYDMVSSIRKKMKSKKV